MGDLKIGIYKKKEELKIGQPVEVEIIQEVNRIPYAQLVYEDGNPAEENFTLSTGDYFLPWNQLDIHFEKESFKKQTLPLFRGIVTRHSIEGAAEGYMKCSRLVVELHSATYKMSLQSRNRVFQEMTDSDIFKQIIQEYDLTVGNIEPTTHKHKEMVQYGCSDWDFLLSRVDANGLWLMVRPDENGKETIDVIKPKLEGEAQHQFLHGVTKNGKTGIQSFEMQADLREHYGTVETLAWNSDEQKPTRTQQALDFKLAQSNLFENGQQNGDSPASISLLSPTTNEEGELQAWADAVMRKTRLSLIQGQLQVTGHYKYQLNHLIALFGFGKRFNGKTLITGIRHGATNEGWLTNIQFGRASDWHVQTYQLQNAPALNMLPGIQGLHIGKVSGYKNDENNRLKVSVNVPDIHTTEGLIWARLASPYAGKNHSFFFRPEIGDEVLLGFLNNDPRYAYILGGIHSEENLPNLNLKKALAPENNLKGIITRQGHQLMWDDAKGIIKLVAKGKNTTHSIQLSHDAKSAGIEMKDGFGNKITMNKKGITIESGKKVEIKGKLVDIQ